MDEGVNNRVSYYEDCIIIVLKKEKMKQTLVRRIGWSIDDVLCCKKLKGGVLKVDSNQVVEFEKDCEECGVIDEEDGTLNREK